MRVVTTVHKEGFDKYGARWIESIDNWPKHTEFVLYAEGFDYQHPRVTVKRTESLERLEAFKAKYRHFTPIGWKYDVVRFANKAFAAADALSDYDDLGIWLDCDAVTYKRIPQKFLSACLPEGFYLGRFARPWLYTETGFWIVDCAHQNHEMFLAQWLKWYEEGHFKTLDEWHDCKTMDATVRAFEKAGLIKVHNLSGEHEMDIHPMAKAEIAKYIDHCKGKRKDKGVSPENTYRKAA